MNIQHELKKSYKKWVNNMNISTKTLVAVAKASLPFMAKTDDRFYLIGAHLVKTKDRLTIETTDGHRAAQIHIDCACGDVGEFDVIVDRDSWIDVSKLKTSSKDTSEVTLTASTNDGEVTISLTLANGATLPLKLIDGRFPSLEGKMRAEPGSTNHIDAEPGSTDHIEFGVNASYALDAFKSAAILASKKYGGTKLIVNSPHDVLTIETPTDHGHFKGLSAPAVFCVMPMRIAR